MSGKNCRPGYTSYLDAQAYYDVIGQMGNSVCLLSDAGSLYHYTSTTVLDSILSTGVFRASNVFYLNDKIEYKMGIDILKQIFSQDTIIQKYLDEIENMDAASYGGVYSISYSSEPDVLQQWITYAKESGVCIELDGNIIWGKEDDLQLGIQCENGSNIRFKKHCFLKLTYQNKEVLSATSDPQLEANSIRYYFADALNNSRNTKTNDFILDEEKINEIWRDNPQEAKEFLQLLAAYFKEERFQGEKEIRAAFLPVTKSRSFQTKMLYYVQENGILRPYINVQFLHKNRTEFSVECPIKTILVGPGGNQENVFKSIVHRLRHGAVKTWKYSPKQLGELLSAYIFGCYQFEQEYNDVDYLIVTNILAKSWCEENNYNYKVSKATRAEVVVKVWENEKGEKLPDFNESESARTIVDRYKCENYFAGNGIWVKKSSLSYLF